MQAALLAAAKKRGVADLENEIDLSAPLPPPKVLPCFYFDQSKLEWVTGQGEAGPVNSHKCDTPERLTFLTWNIDAQTIFKEERSTKALEHIKYHSPDFVCLQEVVPSVWKNLFLTDTWIRDTYYVTDADCSTWTHSVHGTCILSKFKPNRLLLQDFHSQGNRKALILESLSPTSPLSTLCLHLDSGNQPQDYKIRSHQLQTLYTLLSDTPHAIFMGDLNVHLEEPVLPPGGPWADVWSTLRSAEPGYTWDTDVNPFTEFKRRNLPGAAFRTMLERFDRVIWKRGTGWVPEDILIVGKEEIPVMWDGKLFSIFPSDHLALLVVMVRG